MRCIDYWLGVPLCFLLSGISYISRVLILRKKQNTAIQKILFIKLSEMGSIILAYPLIERAKKEYPGAEIFFLTFEKNKPLFEILDIVPYYNILTIREDSIQLFILDTLKAIRRLRKQRIDAVFDLELFSRFTAILTYLTKANKRVGFYRYSFEGLYRGDLLTHKVQYNPLIHISKSFLLMFQVIKEREKSGPELERKIADNEVILPRSIPLQEDRQELESRLRELGVAGEARLFLINPGEGNIPLREWPLENFITLSKQILNEDKRNYIIIVGTQEANQKARILSDSINYGRCINLTGRTTVLELLTLFNISDSLITNDSGLAHLASLTPIKKFIIFGPESPQIYSPLGGNTWIIYSDLPCSPCLSAFNHRKSACRDNRCLKKIKPDEVYEMINRHL